MLCDVTVGLRTGEIVGILGANGAGKSSLVRCFAGLCTPDAGDVTLDARSIGALPPQERARDLGYLPQREPLAEGVTVREYVALGRAPFTGWLGVLSAADEAAVDAALARVGLAAMGRRNLATLSGGEQRRALFARTLCQAPRFWVLDEPLAGLDPGQQWALAETLRALRDAGAGVLWVLHEPGFAERFCDRVWLLAGGRVTHDLRVPDGLTAEALGETLGAVFDDPTCRDGRRGFVTVGAALRGG